MALASEGRTRALYFGAVVLAKCGFYGLLRPIEMINLAMQDVGLPNSILLGGGCVCVLSLLRPKTRRYLGWRQFGLVEEVAAIKWIEWWVEGLVGDTLLFPGTRTELSNLLKEACRYLGLTGLRLGLSGLRTGGATHAFRQHRNLGRLQFAGRWRAPQTLQHYLQESMTAHLVASLPERVRLFLEKLEPRIEQVKLPPPLPVAQVVPWRATGHGRHRRTAAT